MKTDYNLFIDGRWVKPGAKFEVRVPYDGAIFGTAPKANRAEVEQAIAAAKRAAPAAAKLPSHKRYEILMKAATLMQQRAEEFARVIASESGKPIREARGEVGRSAQTLIFSAEEAKRNVGEMVPVDAHPGGAERLGFTLRMPRGVIAAITPFNFPLNLVCHKVGPALAGGNTVVHKPASSTPICGYMLADLFAEAGLPAGFLNTISGGGGEVGDFLVAHPDVAMVTFTGSAEVGKHIRAVAGMKPVTLELGANCAAIVDSDADMELALGRCAIGGFAHSGQVCIHLQRIYVAGKTAGDFTDALRSRVTALRIGHPLDDASDVTSLIDEPNAVRVSDWIAEAERGGARNLIGGKRMGRATVTPAILSGTQPGMKAVADEIFGPVVCVEAFDSIERAVEMVNRSRYGLQAGVFTRDISRALWAAQQIECGGVMINDVPTFRVDQMPYGGVKDSGIGREGPRYALQEMTETKTVVINLTGAPK
jgi:acyl-CoA reductase-like NAD-dependent aldehyde dehydrogenase